MGVKKSVILKQDQDSHPHVARQLLKSLIWFSLGVILGFFFLVSFLYIIYQKTHTNEVYTGVFIDDIDFSGKTKNEIKDFYASKNQSLGNIVIEFTTATMSATISAKQLDFGYDEDLMSEQAFSVGRSGNQLTSISILFQAYFNQIHLPHTYRVSTDALDNLLTDIQQAYDIKPADALFSFNNGRVSAFTLARDGQKVDINTLKEKTDIELRALAKKDALPSKIKIQVPIVKIAPTINNENVNSLGIRELVGAGTSLFLHSIENRIYNVNLAASRLNGILIKPGEVFSFVKALGDVSSFTGYKQAYVIENGRTVLGDGGGVCQVSTTLFRAALDAGLPIIERNPHAYRVGYYEQDSGPGVDAAVYSPTVDLKFKNDTDHHLLIQSYVDLINLRLTFNLYGTKDGREVTIGKPVILSTIPAPEPLYQDDPNLPKGQEKQIDFPAAGASVYFTRSVKKKGEEVINDKFSSYYRPWQAVFLRGTKE